MTVSATSAIGATMTFGFGHARIARDAREQRVAAECGGDRQRDEQRPGGVQDTCPSGSRPGTAGSS